MTVSRVLAAPTRVRRSDVPLSTAALPPLTEVVPPWPGRVVELAGRPLHIRETPGPGPDAPYAVFIHGLGGAASNWTDLAGQLSGHVRGIAVDLPGFGLSHPGASGDFGLPAQAAAMAQFIDGLDQGSVHLFGNSMGGAIALLMAADRPDLIRTLTLVSPAMPDLRLDPRRFSDPRWMLALLPVVGAQVRRSLATVTPRQRAERMLRLCFAEPWKVPEARMALAAAEYAERMAMPWAGRAISRATAGLVRAWLAPAERSLWSAAARVSVPALVIWGSEDRLVSVRKAPRTATLMPRGRLLVLPRTGHVAQMERPVEVARAVLGMWEAVARDEW